MFTTKKLDTFTPSKAPNPRSVPPKPTTRTAINNTQRTSIAAATSTKERTVISQGCFIKGEVSGNSDISIFGKVDGSIMLKDNILTIEGSSDIKASVLARVVNITGKVVGNIDANEKIIIHEYGNVTGDMTAPKVILKDGSYFKGNVSMTNSKVDEVLAKTEKNKPS